MIIGIIVLVVLGAGLFALMTFAPKIGGDTPTQSHTSYRKLNAQARHNRAVKGPRSRL